MTLSVDRALSHSLREEAHPLTGDREDFDALLTLVGDSRFVLIGEASHGTHVGESFRAGLPQVQ